MDGNPIFAMERDTSLDNGLANNEFTPDSSIGYSAISNEPDNWFGFSANVDAFTPPTLGDNEVFTMLFDIDFDPEVREALLGLGLQFASGGTSDPLHPVTYSGEAMVMENEKIPEPSSIFSLLALATLGATSTLKRKLKTSKYAGKELEKVS
ncbi:MAG: PEP-CTERM sorting domain-containing protein [Okeania sp. SIO2D1]|nr:PEP-CTERM sorting domain-containing protein [Okeania sp. SIO2D1]